MIKEHESLELINPEVRITASLFFQVLEMAHNLASAKGSYWEGDIRGNDIYYSGLPPIEANECDCDQWMIAWKQDNNGSTFIGSPFPLENYKDDLIFERNKPADNLTQQKGN